MTDDLCDQLVERVDAGPHACAQHHVDILPRLKGLASARYVSAASE
jgi:hypothetical protein